MTPEEINQLVAEKIMGWTPKPCDLEETGREWTVYDDGYCWCPVCKVSEHISDFEHGIIPPPCYSTDMNAAWFVLKKIGETGIEEREEATLELFDTTWGDLSAFEALDKVATWTPEKICKAALKTIGAI